MTAKSPEEEIEEAMQKSFSAHREGVIWYLQRKLEEAGHVQAGMMEIRLQREEEKRKSVLYQSKAIPQERSTSSTARQADSGTALNRSCLLYTSPSPRDGLLSRMPSSA